MPTETENFEERVQADRRPLPPWEEHWVELAGGRMRYLQAGTGRPLILVHGLMGYSFSWRFTIPALAPHAKVLAIDNLGAGLSVAPERLDCSMTAAADRLLQFAEAMGLSEFDLLGTSHGGALAMLAAAKCAARNDTRLKRLILVAPVNPWSRHGRWLAPAVGGPVGSYVFNRTIARWRFLDYIWLRRMFGQGRKIPLDSLEGYRKPVRENRAFQYGVRIVGTWTADLKELERSLPAIAEYPTLVVWGTRDRAVSFRSAEPLKKVFRDCRVVAFPGVGHLPYEEAPEEFNRALLSFLVPSS